MRNKFVIEITGEIYDNQQISNIDTTIKTYSNNKGIYDHEDDAPKENSFPIFKETIMDIFRDAAGKMMLG